ncbi:MAG: hypothetical protein ACXWJK_07745 [Burkholderiaceae bacterium]
MQINKSERLRNIAAQEWTVMFFVFLANITIDMIKGIINNNSAKWAEHIGMFGHQVILTVMVIYAVMLMLIKLSSDKPFGFFHALDLTHHVLGIWVIVAATMWARQPD